MHVPSRPSRHKSASKEAAVASMPPRQTAFVGDFAAIAVALVPVLLAFLLLSYAWSH